MPPETIPRLVAQAAERFADAEAIVDGDERITFADLDARVREAAAATIAAGVEPGDRVAIWAPNSWRWVVAALGALTAGAALVPLNTRYKGSEAAYIIGTSGARTAFVSPPFLGNDYPAMLDAERSSLPELGSVVTLDDDGWKQFLAGASSVSADQVDERAAAVAADAMGDLFFTSGTTGRPKAVVTTQAQSLRVFTTWSEVVGLDAGHRYLIVNPFFHTFGYKAGILACLLRGATMVPLASFDVPTVLATLERERISVLAGPPTLFQSVLDAPDRNEHDLSALQIAVTGAAVVPVSLIERMRGELSFHTVLTAYGLTEATGTVTMCRREDDAVTIATTSGRAIPDTEVRIVGSDGAEVPAGEAGEVVVRGYNVMVGYFDDPDATAQTIDADGWLHTGDIGVMDERGYVRITDRLKDMFIVGGFNAYPAEIEAALAGHPALAEAAVIGVPDERLGEVGKAFVVARPGMTVDADEVIEWSRRRMANFKVPRVVEVVDALPRNASGKVVKPELRARTEQG